MISRRSYNTKIRHSKSGLILVDILIAMALAVLFIALITEASVGSRDIFESAKERSRLMNEYVDHAEAVDGMMPYESRQLTIPADGWKYSTTTISARARWYGNDRIQTDITITATNSASTTQSDSITFNVVQAYPFSNINDVAGTPLCSVDFSNKNIVGSYGFLAQNSASQKNPQIVELEIIPIALPIDPLLPLTDFQVRNGRAYISTDSSKAADPDVLIFDIRDSNNPILSAGINTGPGISSIALAGNKIYAAVTSKVAQLQVIGINAPDNLRIDSNYKLPLPEASTTPTLGSAVFYDRGRVYLGTEKWDGYEFVIIDVSDPLHPVQIGGYEIGSKAGSIYVRDGIAFVTASGEQQLLMLDVHDPTNPVLLDSLSPSGWERQGGRSLSFFEDSLGLGRTSGGFNIKLDHELFMWNLKQNFGHSGQNMPQASSTDISGGVYGLVADRSFVYVATRQTGREFQIFDYGLSTTTVKTVSLPVPPQAMTCDGDSLYVLGSTAPIIHQIKFK